MESRLNILVLAGRRPGPLDALAVEAGVTHKCLVPVRGRPLIARTLNIVAEAFPQARLFISTQDPELVASEATVAALQAQGRLKLLPASAGLAQSVLEATGTTGFPLLITTADNILMTAEALHRLEREARATGADAYVTFARKEDILATHPEGEVRFFWFKGGAYSNCNMFWLAGENAKKTLKFFAEGGQFAKRPERLLKAFGLLNLIRYKLGWYTVERMFAIISRRFGVDIRIVVMPEGRLAIDVDDERTKRVAEEILARDEAA